MEMTSSQIVSILDHKYPMVLIDSVTSIKRNKFCNAFKNLTYNEWFFPSHFKNNPIMPGSLQIEAFTQAVALPLMISENMQRDSKISVLLAGVDKVRFYESICPGDKLNIEVNIERIAMGIATSKVKGKVGGKLVSECMITYKIISV
tara:strand:- start:15 stop:455 length:441 start_codon:yes stop_codon:yes gene_type:complete